MGEGTKNFSEGEGSLSLCHILDDWIETFGSRGRRILWRRCTDAPAARCCRGIFVFNTFFFLFPL